MGTKLERFTDDQQEGIMKNLFRRVPLPIWEEPPTRLAPAVAGRWLHGWPRARHMSAALFDLAERGFLTISQEEDDVIFRQAVQKMDGLALYEQLWLKDLFGIASKTPFRVLPPRLRQLMQAAAGFLEEERREIGQLKTKSDKQAWQGFKQFLQLNEPAKAPELFAPYFAYAVAFGVADKWTSRFDEMTKLALPAWYFTPVEKDHLAGLFYLAEVIEKLLGEEARPFTLPVIPEALLHGRDAAAGSGG
jgi:hypothetical protein